MDVQTSQLLKVIGIFIIIGIGAAGVMSYFLEQGLSKEEIKAAYDDCIEHGGEHLMCEKATP